MGNLTSEVPSELKSFAAIFDKLSYKHSDYSSIFSDFVGYWVGSLLINGDPDLAEELKRRYGIDYPKFNQLVIEMIMAYDKKINDHISWYDGLGIFYETIASRYKSSALGQFFTPPSLVDIMCQLVNPGSRDSVSDCCCGSGRMLLSAKANNPKVWTYGADLDPICAKMSAINMAVHGCRGEVSCMDSLNMDWRFGYVLNPYFQFKGVPPIPHLMKVLRWNESVFYVTAPEISEVILDDPEVGQLTLF